MKVFTLPRENSRNHSSSDSEKERGADQVSSPEAKTPTMWGWSNRERNSTSCLKRTRVSSGMPSWRILSATRRPVLSWRALCTVANPPEPTDFPTRKSPRSTPFSSSGAAFARNAFTSRSWASALPRSLWNDRRTGPLAASEKRRLPSRET